MAKAENLVTSIQVEIEAPASLVWEVLTDVDRYAEWNSFCPGLKTSGRLGDLVCMQVRIPGTDQTIPVNEYLVAYEPERLLSWEQRPTDANKDAARRDQYIETVGPGRCRYFTTDLFLGLNADTIMREHGAWVKQGFDQVARDVKARAEALHARQRAGRGG
ncbi:SRPBCC domain-containing protein [Cupriavidus necator]|uniref:SRPBCC domain-containing protein n=1 Tax=Cupriavidus necator TaxID=106590 RepID=UPI0039C26662